MIRRFLSKGEALQDSTELVDLPVKLSDTGHSRFESVGVLEEYDFLIVGGYDTNVHFFRVSDGKYLGSRSTSNDSRELTRNIVTLDNPNEFWVVNRQSSSRRFTVDEGVENLVKEGKEPEVTGSTFLQYYDTELSSIFVNKEGVVTELLVKTQTGKDVRSGYVKDFDFNGTSTVTNTSSSGKVRASDKMFSIDLDTAEGVNHKLMYVTASNFQSSSYFRESIVSEEPLPFSGRRVELGEIMYEGSKSAYIAGKSGNNIVILYADRVAGTLKVVYNEEETYGRFWRALFLRKDKVLLIFSNHMKLVSTEGYTIETYDKGFRNYSNIWDFSKGVSDITREGVYLIGGAGVSRIGGN